MNAGRVIAAGLLAGLVLNVGEAVLHGVALAAKAEAAMQALGKDVAGTPVGLTMLVLVTFAQGLVGIWLYARTRSEATVLHAVTIGLVLWLLSSLYSGVYLYAGFPGAFPDDVVWWPVAWEAVQYPLAILVGAAILPSRTRT